MKRALAVLVLALMCVEARAETWLVLSGLSHHSGSAASHCEYNPGLGLEQSLTERTRFVGGFYKNSLCRETVYLGATWMPLQVGPVKAGVLAGGATGYQRSVSAAGAGVIAIEGGGLGLNLLFIPKMSNINDGNVYGLQLKGKF